jgi:hypothetical protein
MRMRTRLSAMVPLLRVAAAKSKGLAPAVHAAVKALIADGSYVKILTKVP